MKLPATLTLNGRQLKDCGTGRTTGALQYLDMARGELYELYLAQVESTGPVFSLAAIAGNPALRQALVPHGVLQSNDHSQPRLADAQLVEHDYAKSTPGRPIPAKAAWLMTARPDRPALQPAPRPVPQVRLQSEPAPAPRFRGTLREIHGNTGYLIEDGSGERVFVHRHQNVGQPFKAGARVSYRGSRNTHGVCAAEGRAA